MSSFMHGLRQTCNKALLKTLYTNNLSVPRLSHTPSHTYTHLTSSVYIMFVRYSRPLHYCSCFGARVCWGWERPPLSKGMQMSRVHLTSFHDPCRPPAPHPAGAVCHILDRAVALPLAPERGNGSVQSFTSTALRLTESIKEDRPPRSPCAHPFSFLSALSICPNYFCLGCQRRFLAKGDRAEINSEHVGSCH